MIRSAVLTDIAGLIGEVAAMKLVSAYGGQRLYVPAPDSVDQGHALARTIGLNEARALAEEFAGIGTLYIPLASTSQAAQRHAAIVEARAGGASIPVIARRLKVSTRCVEKRLAKAREIRRGPDLFD